MGAADLCAVGGVVVKLGLFGGTFDPPHIGHLLLAQVALEFLQLDQVLWILTGQSPFKMDSPPTTIEIRQPLLLAALADHPQFSISTVDMDRPPPHYTADTVQILAAQYPESQRIWLMGGDSLQSFPRWERAASILQFCEVAVWERPTDRIDWNRLHAAMPNIAGKVTMIPAPLLDISSSDIRARARAGKSLRYWVMPQVATFIHTHALYR